MLTPQLQWLNRLWYLFAISEGLSESPKKLCKATLMQTAMGKKFHLIRMKRETNYLPLIAFIVTNNKLLISDFVEYVFLQLKSTSLLFSRFSSCNCWFRRHKQNKPVWKAAYSLSHWGICLSPLQPYFAQHTQRVALFFWDSEIFLFYCCHKLSLYLACAVSWEASLARAWTSEVDAFVHTLWPSFAASSRVLSTFVLFRCSFFL